LSLEVLVYRLAARKQSGGSRADVDTVEIQANAAPKLVDVDHEQARIRADIAGKLAGHARLDALRENFRESDGVRLVLGEQLFDDLHG